MTENNENIRPWGSYDILSESKDYKVKQIKVNQGQRLSYQYHNSRDEYWVVVEGDAEVIIDGETKKIGKGGVVAIKRNQKHRVKNVGSSQLRFIEIQLGEYFGEDDIVRLEDDYQRS